MKHNLNIFLFLITMMTMTSCNMNNRESALLKESEAPFGVPEFHLYNTGDYLDAFKYAIEEKRNDIKSIINNSDEPTYANTIDALELSGKRLEKVSGIFFNLNESDNTPAMTEVEMQVMPMLTDLDAYIFMNDSLFARIRSLYEKKESLQLDEEQQIVLDNYYRRFVRGGALLNEEQKARLLEINTQLGLLQIEFNNNLLADSKEFKLIITDKEKLSGLPEGVCEAANEAAEAIGCEGWLFTLDKPSCIPFLQYADNRELREKVYKAYYNRGGYQRHYRIGAKNCRYVLFA